MLLLHECSKPAHRSTASSPPWCSPMLKHHSQGTCQPVLSSAVPRPHLRAPSDHSRILARSTTLTLEPVEQKHTASFKALVLWTIPLAVAAAQERPTGNSAQQPDSLRV